MKLNTSIPPRRSGAVLAHAAGATYEFLPGDDGELSCDVSDPQALAALLATGNFYPADEADFEQALRLAEGAASGGIHAPPAGPSAPEQSPAPGLVPEPEAEPEPIPVRRRAAGSQSRRAPG